VADVRPDMMKVACVQVGTETNATFLLVNPMNHSNVRPCVSALELVNCIIDCLLSRLDDTSLYCFLNPASIVPP
jgi:hypothetical protein